MYPRKFRKNVRMEDGNCICILGNVILLNPGRCLLFEGISLEICRGRTPSEFPAGRGRSFLLAIHTVSFLKI